MKNSTIIFTSIIFSIFFFSCNTEAKFGFRKKIKANVQATAKTITKPKLAKVETKSIDSTTEEIITSSIADEKIILPKTEQHHFKTSPSFSINKIVADSTNQKKNSVATLPKKKLNTLSMLGLLLGITGFIGNISGILILYLVTQTVYLIIPFLLSSILAIVLSSYGLKQIRYNPEKYSGKGFGIAGIILGIIGLLILIIFLMLILGLLVNRSSPTGP